MQTLLSKVFVQISKSKFATRLHELYSIFVVVIIRNKNLQMKYIAVILSVYVMVLTAIPCNDVHAGTNSATLELAEQSQNHTSDVDLCSPFCFCHCCQTLSFPSFFNGLLSNVEVVALNITFKESRFSNHFSSIWQPPKI